MCWPIPSETASKGPDWACGMLRASVSRYCSSSCSSDDDPLYTRLRRGQKPTLGRLVTLLRAITSCWPNRAQVVVSTSMQQGVGKILARMHTHTVTHVYSHTHTHSHSDVCVFTHIHTESDTRVFTHTEWHMYLHTHTHSDTCVFTL